MSKIIVAILLALSVSPALAAVKVIFVPGASLRAGSDTSVLEAAFQQTIRTRTGASDLEFEVFPLFQTAFESVNALGCQNALELQANSGSLPVSLPDYSIYLSRLGAIYNDFESNSKKYCGLLKGISKSGIATAGLASKIISYRNSGWKVVVAAFSQGNLYAEAAVASLIHSGAISDYSDIPVVNIGNMASTVISGRLITVVKDRVVAQAGHLPGNITLCVGACVEEASISQMMAVGADSDLHTGATYFNAKVLVWNSSSRGVALPVYISDQIAYAAGLAVVSATIVSPSLSVDFSPSGLAVVGAKIYGIHSFSTTPESPALKNSISLNGGYIDIPHGSALDATGGITYDLWVYFNTNTEYFQSLVDKFDIWPKYGTGFGLFYDKMYAAASIGACYGDLDLFPQIPTRTWVRTTVSYSSTEIKIYINKSIYMTCPNSLAMFTKANAHSLFIGAARDEYDRRYLYGKVSDLKVYRATLSPAQVASLD